MSDTTEVWQVTTEDGREHESFLASSREVAMREAESEYDDYFGQRIDWENPTPSGVTRGSFWYLPRERVYIYVEKAKVRS